jgi:small subunit ribosomal protein S16e
LIQPELLKIKVFEPLFLIEEKKFGDIDIRVRVRGGGKISQIYAIRQAIAKGLVLYLEKYGGETQKTEMKDILLNYDRSLLVADTRTVEAKKFGGKGARSRYQKSYR